MSGNPALDLIILSISIFNTILLIWLGLTVLLDVRRRTLGVWLAGEGLLMGAAFFTSHSIILAQGFNSASQTLDFWWHVGWIPVVLSPFAWYSVILWYTGFWEDLQSELFHRQAAWFGIVLVFTALLIGLFLFSNPLPSLDLNGQFEMGTTPALAGVPLLAMLYPVYIMTCIFLALDSLLRPGPVARLMGDQARRRARPWLIGSTLILLLVSLLVAWALFWIVSYSKPYSLPQLINQMGTTLAIFDLVISALIAIAVLLIGQAVVHYEVFTGKVLPHHGLKRYWRNMIWLATGISPLVAWNMMTPMNSIYTSLLVIVLITIFYALNSWRSLLQYDQSIAKLRPFLTSQNIYGQILTNQTFSLLDTDVAAHFQALCENILNTSKGTLVALGPLSALVSTPLVYPENSICELPPLSLIKSRLESLQNNLLSLSPAENLGFIWAISIVSERGLVGILLLGEKADQGFYTQEEIDIARASSERLLDLRAGAELSRRLVAIQRQRMAESQVVDRRMRRILHDEILPRLHTALISMNSQIDATLPDQMDSIKLLTETHHQLSNFLRDMPVTIPPTVSKHGLFGALHLEIDKELNGAFDQVNWQIDPQVEEIAPSLPQMVIETAFFAARETIRNAALHGRSQTSSKPFILTVQASIREGLQLIIEDNGVGMKGSSEESRGSGQGMELHSTLMTVVGGSMEVSSTEGELTRVILNIPLATALYEMV